MRNCGGGRVGRTVGGRVSRFDRIVLNKLARRPILGLSRGLGSFLPKSLSCYFFSSSNSITMRITLGVTLRFGVGHNDKEGGLLSLAGSCRKSAFVYVGTKSSRSCRFVLSRSSGGSMVRVPARVSTLRGMFQARKGRFCTFVMRPLLRKTNKVGVCDVSFLEETERLYGRCSIIFVFSRITANFKHAKGHFISSLMLPSVVILKGTLATKCVKRTIAMTGRGVCGKFCSSGSASTLVRNPAFVKGPITYDTTLGSVRVFRHRGCVRGVGRVRSVIEGLISKFARPLVGRVECVNNYLYFRMRSPSYLVKFRRCTCRQKMFSEPFLSVVCTVFPCVVRSGRVERVISIVGS